jgi:hypothetical protein
MIAVAVLGIEGVLAALAVADPSLAAFVFGLAKVVAVGVEPAELYERVELADPILQRSARETPPEDGVERKRSLCSR